MKHGVLSFTLLITVLMTAACATKEPEKNQSAITSTLFDAASTAEQSNDYKSAIQYYQRLLLRVPDDPTIALALARNLRYVGAETEALSILEGSEILDDQSTRYLIEYAKTKIALGKSTDAIEKLDSAAQQAPDNWEIHYLLGITYDLNDDFTNAHTSYKKALSLSEDNPTIYNNMAISAALSGDIDKAISILNGVPRLTRNNAQLRQNLAFFYGIRGDTSSAAALARKDLDEESVQQNLKIYSQFRTY